MVVIRMKPEGLSPYLQQSAVQHICSQLNPGYILYPDFSILFLLLSFHLILVSQALSEELMRTTKNFFASNRCPANISKGAPVEYESRVLLLQRTIRARCWHNDDDYALYFRPPVQRVSYSISWLKTRISRRNFTKKPNECVRMEKMNHLYQTNQNLLSTLNPAWRSR